MGGFTGADSAHVQLLTAMGWAVAALVVIWHTGGSLAPNNRPSLGLLPLHAVPSKAETKIAGTTAG